MGSPAIGCRNPSRQAQRRACSVSDLLSHPHSQTCEPAVDAKGLPTGEMIVRDDPMENRRDERMFWSSLIPVLATNHAEMEPTWHVLDEIVQVSERCPVASAAAKGARALLPEIVAPGHLPNSWIHCALSILE